jgi:hypothetical protein
MQWVCISSVTVMMIMIHYNYYFLLLLLLSCRDSSVGLATRLRAGLIRSRGSIAGAGKIFLPSALRPDRLRSPPSRLFSGYKWLFSGGER